VVFALHGFLVLWTERNGHAASVLKTVIFNPLERKAR
jgi:hypothetical protein